MIYGDRSVCRDYAVLAMRKAEKVKPKEWSRESQKSGSLSRRKLSSRTMKIPFAWSKLNALLNNDWAFQFVSLSIYRDRVDPTGDAAGEQIMETHTVCRCRVCACTSVCEVHEDWDAERKRLKTRIRQAVKVVPECVFNRRVHYASLYCGRSPRHGDDHSTRLVWLESSADLLVSHKFANRRRRCRRIVRQAQRYLESISLAMCTSTINPRRTSLRSRALWMNAKCRQILPI